MADTDDHDAWLQSIQCRTGRVDLEEREVRILNWSAHVTAVITVGDAFANRALPAVTRVRWVNLFFDGRNESCQSVALSRQFQSRLGNGWLASLTSTMVALSISCQETFLESLPQIRPSR